MNKNLANQISSIVDIDPNVMIKRRTAWLRAHQKRLNFLKQLRSKIEKMSFKDNKESSRYYSDAVVAYDKNNMVVF